MRRKLASDELREGGFSSRPKVRPEPEEYGAPADWMLFDAPAKRTAAPVVQIQPQGNQGDELNISQADWKGAGKHSAPPIGNHTMVIRSAWSHKPASGGPNVLALLWTPIEGPYQGATVWQALGLYARQEASRKAAISWLRRIWEAAGCDPTRLPTKPEDLAGLVCQVAVAHKPHWADPSQTVAYVQGVAPAPEVA